MNNAKVMVPDYILVRCVDEQAPPEVMQQVHEPFEHFGIYFEATTKDHITTYKGMYKGLQFLYRGREFTMTNSLHKAYHGNNFSDFTATQSAEMVKELDELTGGIASTGRVTKAEYGVNIALAHPEQLYNDWIYYRTQKVSTMRSNRGKVYGNVIELSEYDIKGYSKTAQHKIDKNLSELSEGIARYEVRGRSRWLQRTGGIYTLKDLANPAKLQRIANAGIDIYTRIMKRDIDFRLLTIEEKKILGVMQDEPLREDIQQNHPDSYKRYRQAMKKIRIKAAKTDEITPLLKAKIEAVLNS